MDKQKNKGIWEYSGIFLIITGILHTIVALVLGKDTYLEIIHDGLINTIADNYTREFAFWFLICGIILIVFGQILHYYIRKEQKPAPLFLGYYLLIFAILGCIVEPISGFWLFIPQALIIILANKKM
ncbi:MAG: DUF6463 family protein [Prevotella sp.]|jgi:uncharacterized membrane protein HdeD (DUF308 family)|nr:DUF6463 family protein [Prevotella sp.]